MVLLILFLGFISIQAYDIDNYPYHLQTPYGLNISVDYIPPLRSSTELTVSYTVDSGLHKCKRQIITPDFLYDIGGTNDKWVSDNYSETTYLPTGTDILMRFECGVSGDIFDHNITFRFASVLDSKFEDRAYFEKKHTSLDLDTCFFLHFMTSSITYNTCISQLLHSDNLNQIFRRQFEEDPKDRN